MWCDSFGERIVRDRRLADLTSVRVGGRARWLALPSDDADVGDLLAVLGSEGIGHRVLGGGSNLLPPDETVEDVVVHPVHLDGFEADGARVVTGAGCSLSSLVARANGLGLAGLHLLSGIPGQVGGAVVMNAGGRYGEIGPLVERVHGRLPGGEAATLPGEEIGFAYRTSHLPDGFVITSVELRLEPTDDPRALKRESGRIIKEKNAAQPTREWNFGCMFKNPEGESAGVLIDRAGLKGRVEGGARISPLHGNFVENTGEATAADVRTLLDCAEAAVRERFGITLMREVRVWTA